MDHLPETGKRYRMEVRVKSIANGLVRAACGASLMMLSGYALLQARAENETTYDKMIDACFVGYWLHYGYNIDADTRSVCLMVNKLYGQKTGGSFGITGGEEIGYYRNDKKRDFILSHEKWVSEQLIDETLK